MLDLVMTAQIINIEFNFLRPKLKLLKLQLYFLKN